MHNLCGLNIGTWQSYGVIDSYSVPHVNWKGKNDKRDIMAHHYIDKTELHEGKPACELNIWIDSLAVRYMEKHGLKCEKPEQGNVFFRLEFPNNEIYLDRHEDGYCKDKLLFIAGNEDGSLTIVAGQETPTGFTLTGLTAPFEDKKIHGYKGKLLSADKYGKLSDDIKDIVIAPVPVSFKR